MKTGTIHFKVFFLLLILCGIQIVYYAPQLPDQVASHFAMDGRADGWSSREAFILYYAVFFLFMAFTFFLIALFLPKIPPDLISMPGKDYWLTPERKAQTLEFLSERLLAMGNATLCFILILFQAIIQANIEVVEGEVRSGLWFWILLALYFAYVTVWTVRLFRALRKPS